MTDHDRSASDANGGGFSISRVLLVVIPLALIAMAARMYSGNLEQTAKDELDRTIAWRLLGETAKSTELAHEYQDANNDLVADPPADKAKLLDPKELRFSYVATSSGEHEDETWKELLAALAEACGRPVKLVSYADVGEQMRALKSGDLHITAFTTGEVPAAVNEAGLVPLASFANKDGAFRTSMKIIVPADSDIKELEGLRDRRVTFVRPGSNSGCTAALVTLMKQHDLLPERDYRWGFSFGHEASIKGVAEKRFEAAAVASDFLERMVVSGEINGDSIRTIYESNDFPPSVIGCAYSIDPKLQEKIRETLVNFDWAGTGLEKTYGPQDSVKFAVVSYKDDWAPVREMNEHGREVLAKLGAPTTTSQAQTTAEPAETL